MDEDDPREQIVRLEARIEELAGAIASCRKLIAISKVAIAGGGAMLLAVLLGLVSFDPAGLVGAIAAIVGGTVLLGSNASTLKQSTEALRAAEVERARLIGEIELRVVDDRPAARALPPTG